LAIRPTITAARVWFHPPADQAAENVEVDLILLSRDLSPPRRDVWAGVQSQGEVVKCVHRVVGRRLPTDPNRYETIARARNDGKSRGTAPWVMYIDDDVVLGRDCVALLVDGLSRKPGFAALAADSAGEMSREWGHWDYPAHVGMAATLFRREALADLTFRWEPGKCECRCCCDDLRRAGFGIGYHPPARAWHRPVASRADRASVPDPDDEKGPSAPPRSPTGGRILTAFDRNHFDRFRRQFLPSLRASGNREPLFTVAYGIYPSERARLRAAGIEVKAMPANGAAAALRRLRDFQDVIADWPQDTPVAFWDAGDVLFQGSLAPLWDLVRAHPDQLLVVREPVAIGTSPVIGPWTDYIRDPAVRGHTRALLATNPFINAGFAAGTVRAVQAYLRAGDRLLNTILKGVLHWGDQVAMGHYLHNSPSIWREIPDGWNYCMIFRNPSTYRVRADGMVESRDGMPIRVIHGNGRTLEPWAFSFA
jgi:hypothetical protein